MDPFVAAVAAADAGRLLLALADALAPCARAAADAGLVGVGGPFGFGETGEFGMVYEACVLERVEPLMVNDFACRYVSDVVFLSKLVHSVRCRARGALEFACSRVWISCSSCFPIIISKTDRASRERQRPPDPKQVSRTKKS